MVEYVDGSILAQISVTDMRLPILYALAWPERPASTLTFDLAALRHLEFEPPDFERFPCLRLAFEAAEKGGAHCIALNAADEVAVEAFLERRIPFTGIPRTIEKSARVYPGGASRDHCGGARRRPAGARAGPGNASLRLAGRGPGRALSRGQNLTSMHEFLVSAVAFIVLVGVMVIVHESGHFVVAKLCGVRVEAFSFGFGPRLFGFKYGETDYKVCLLPLGGFVKMTGETESGLTQSPSDVTGEEAASDPAAFSSHPRWQRMLIGLAGPTANFALTLALMTFYYGFINEVPTAH